MNKLVFDDMTNKRILWVHSSSMETQSYRDALTDRGYSVDNTGNTADALFMMESRVYEAVCLSPFFLSCGIIDAARYPAVERLDLRDSFSVGLFLYKIIRKRQSDVPIFFVPIGLRKNKERLERELGVGESKRIFDLLNFKPSELSEIVAGELR